MISILFVCHGNICRSPMAEYVMKYLVASRHSELMFVIGSAATSTEEIGNPIHRGTKRILVREGIPFDDHRARQVACDEYADWDLFVCLDEENVRMLKRRFGGDPDRKIVKLLSYAGSDDDVTDPWYTGDFDTTYRDVLRGCEGLLREVAEDS